MSDNPTSYPLLVKLLPLPSSRGLPADSGVLMLTLNAERSLNALSLDMIDGLSWHLEQARNDERIQAIILSGSGSRAFCAGGDIVNLYQSLTGEREADFLDQFFTREYRLDYTIHTYDKPIICLADGIVMGGGMGLMNGCSHRIVTEKSHLAMPEVSIGLFPDVGGSWFLNRMPGKLGLFLALTGSSLSAEDALYLGMADRFISHENLAALPQALQEADWTSGALVAVNETLRALERQPNGEESQVRKHRKILHALMDHDDLPQLIERLTNFETEDRWLAKAQTTLKRGSPLAMHLIHEQLKRTRHASLREVFQQELILAIQCGRQGDFREGVRALLIDKDNKPQWRFPDVRSVPQTDVEACFMAPWEHNPLADL